MKRLYILPVILLFAVLFFSCKEEDEIIPKFELVWGDEFDGSSLDMTKWSYMYGSGCQFGTPMCGWGNSELQYYTDRPENVWVENGRLKIRVLYEPDYNGTGYDYTSARLRTRGKGDWQYGKFEARIKLPSAQSVWPAFWMLPYNSNWPHTGEIDIMESRHANPTEWMGTIHYQNPNPADCDGNSNGCHNHTGFNRTTFGDLSSQFNTYAIEWEPGVIRWFVNDEQQGEVLKSSIPGWPFDDDNPFHFLLNVAVGGPDTGFTNGTWPNSSHYPTTMEVDYVRAYELAW